MKKTLFSTFLLQRISRAIILFCSLLFCMSFPFLMTAAPLKQKIMVAVLLDGDSVYGQNRKQLKLIKDDIAKFDTRGSEIFFLEDPSYNANLDLSKAKEILNQVQKDPKIDIVLAMGPLFTAATAQTKLPLKKPVISTFVEGIDAIGLPHSERGFSTKANFTFIVTPLRMAEDTSAFYRMVHFKKLYILVDKKMFDAFSGIRKEMKYFASQLGTDLAMITYSDTAENALSKIGNDVHAIYLAPRLSLSGLEWQKLIEGINKKSIPSFSMNGYNDVYKGVLAALSATNTEKVARKTSANLYEVAINGAKPEELSVYMPVEGRLLINAITADQIGYWPSFGILREADFINADKLQKTIWLMGFLVLFILLFLIAITQPFWKSLAKAINDNHEVLTEKWLVNDECWEYTYERLPDGVKKLLTQHKVGECTTDKHEKK